jgi:hypothetical protein
MKTTNAVQEPDFQAAAGWWADLPNTWTTLGWKDHLFRFNVLWNGTLLNLPSLNNRTEAWAGQEAQIAFAPHYTEWFPAAGVAHASYAYLTHDDGLCRQGWEAGAAPVLWTDIPKDGLMHRIRMFAHIPGGGPVRTGIDPLFAWVRLSVHGLCPALPLEKVAGFHVIVQNPHLGTSMSTRRNVVANRENGRHVYPRALAPEAGAYEPEQGLRLLEPDGRVRLAVAPGQKDLLGFRWFTPAEKGQADYRLYVQLPARKDAHVDILIPLLPCEREVFDAELAKGYAGALRETARYWKGVTATPTVFETPEADVNDVLRQSVRFSHMLAEKNPATGKVCKVSGSWVYTALWTTPLAMDLIMLMDLFGHGRAVGPWLDIFREEQGTVCPPGKAYTPHPGFLSTPALYKSIDWISDNGAVLWILAMHGLLSGDRAWLEGAAEAMVKSCDWIRDMRRKTGHGGVEGVLPPGVASDNGTQIQACWSNGWNYLGMVTAVRALRRLGHPRAEELACEAAAYKADFIRAFRAKCKGMPAWTDSRGRKRRFVPSALFGEQTFETRHAFILDGGSLFLVFAGLMDADEPEMRDLLAWFREGPAQALYRRDSNCWQVPVLDHEMSSCEPCYSWNVLLSWQSGDRARFLEGMYSVFAGGVSRQTRISCETRGGVTGNVFSAPLALYAARLAVIDDQLRDGELHLLRLAPAAWLKPGDRCRFEAMPTEYGPVTLKAERSADGGTLAIEWKPSFRDHAPKVLLHCPPLPELRRLLVNGKTVKPGRGPCVLRTT